MGIKIAVVTQDEPFFMPEFFSVFLPALPDGVELTDITLLQTMDDSLPELVWRAYTLFGPVNVVRYGIEYCRRSLLDAVGHATYSVETLARQHGVTVEHRETVNCRSYRERVADVDVVLSVSSPEIFEAELLSAPAWGCINVHTSKLPQYRGMMPTFWAMYHEDEEFGVTVHTMVEEVDAGKILAQTTEPIPDDASLPAVIKHGKRTGGRLAIDVLKDIRDETVTQRPMDGEGSYFSFPTVEERKQFQRRGGRLW